GEQLELDERSLLLLQEIIALSNVRIEDVSIKYGLSKDQINYSYKKINEWLEVNHLPLIIKDAKGNIRCKTNNHEQFLKVELEKKA
ncbi:hypothetical protein R0J90_19090, partial [Micrococcus sp. SIMBA_144]